MKLVISALSVIAISCAAATAHAETITGNLSINGSGTNAFTTSSTTLATGILFTGTGTFTQGNDTIDDTYTVSALLGANPTLTFVESCVDTKNQGHCNQDPTSSSRSWIPTSPVCPRARTVPRNSSPSTPELFDDHGRWKSGKRYSSTSPNPLPLPNHPRFFSSEPASSASAVQRRRLRSW